MSAPLMLTTNVPRGKPSATVDSPHRRGRGARANPTLRQRLSPRPSASELLSIVGVISLRWRLRLAPSPGTLGAAGNLAVGGCEGDEEAAVVVERGEEVADDALEDRKSKRLN